MDKQTSDELDPTYYELAKQYQEERIFEMNAQQPQEEPERFAAIDEHLARVFVKVARDTGMSRKATKHALRAYGVNPRLALQVLDENFSRPE